MICDRGRHAKHPFHWQGHAYTLFVCILLTSNALAYLPYHSLLRFPIIMFPTQVNSAVRVCILIPLWVCKGQGLPVAPDAAYIVHMEVCP